MKQSTFLLDRYQSALRANDVDESIRCLIDLGHAYRYAMIKNEFHEMMIVSRIPIASDMKDIGISLTVRSDEIFQSFMAFAAHNRYNGLFSEMRKIYDENKSKEYSIINEMFMFSLTHLFDDFGKLCEEDFSEGSLFHISVEHGANVPYNIIKSLGEEIRNISGNSDITSKIHNSPSTVDVNADTGNFNIIVDGIRYADDLIEQFHTGKLTEKDIEELAKSCEAMDHIMRNNVVVMNDKEEKTNDSN